MVAWSFVMGIFAALGYAGTGLAELEPETREEPRT